MISLPFLANSQNFNICYRKLFSIANSWDSAVRGIYFCYFFQFWQYQVANSFRFHKFHVHWGSTPFSERLWRRQLFRRSTDKFRFAPTQHRDAWVNCRDVVNNRAPNYLSLSFTEIYIMLTIDVVNILTDHLGNRWCRMGVSLSTKCPLAYIFAVRQNTKTIPQYRHKFVYSHKFATY